MFRINIYLDFFKFLRSIFFFKNSQVLKKDISKTILAQTKKKNIIFSSQCRIAFLYLLKYLKKKDPKKNEIIFCSYNLAEMLNVAKNLNYKIKFCDLDKETGFLDIKSLNKLISKKTKALVLTNMFNTFQQSKNLKNILKKKNILLIEDNAIYFDNFTKEKNKKIFSGSLGDFSIYSFNIMKQLSAFYGGALATNNKEFIDFFNKEEKLNKDFFLSKLIHQVMIYLILKIMANKILFKLIFVRLIRLAHKKKILFILKLFYPSLKFKIITFPKYYFTKISNFSLKNIYLQLNDYKQRKKNFAKRKANNVYYYKTLSKIKNSNIKLIKISDFDYQNFLDFPILIKNKKEFNNFLLKRGIEVKYIHYRNCERIFSSKKFKCVNSQKFENDLVCLPNHKKVTFKYIDKVVSCIKEFLNENKKTASI